MTDTVLWPPGVTPTAQPQPCRYCARTAWLADTAGPLHPCCRSNAARFAAGLGCPACRASERSAARDFDHTAFDRRAVASGKRRASLAAYRQAQTSRGAAP